MGYSYSIIIPHYDIPDLLMRCLESIPVREDIQVIVVDDHSPGGEVLQERYPALNRPYLSFMRLPENEGAGNARNVGMEKAEGKWLIFADADDFFLPGAFDVFDSHLESEADMIYFRYTRAMSDDIQAQSSRDMWLEALFSQYLDEGNETGLRGFDSFCLARMIRRSLVAEKGIRFEPVKYSEDDLFAVTLGCEAGPIEVVDIPVYCLTERPGSICARDVYFKRPGEVEVRLQVAFRKNLLTVTHFNTVHWFVVDLLRLLLEQDRKKFFQYLKIAPEYKVPRLKVVLKIINRKLRGIY